eukprot:scaffold87876_cov66-Phaeocystis_antarctica.AAC.2
MQPQKEPRRGNLQERARAHRQSVIKRFARGRASPHCGCGAGGGGRPAPQFAVVTLVAAILSGACCRGFTLPCALVRARRASPEEAARPRG